MGPDLQELHGARVSLYNRSSVTGAALLHGKQFQTGNLQFNFYQHPSGPQTIEPTVPISYYPPGTGSEETFLLTAEEIKTRFTGSGKGPRKAKEQLDAVFSSVASAHISFQAFNAVDIRSTGPSTSRDQGGQQDHCTQQSGDDDSEFDDSPEPVNEVDDEDVLSQDAPADVPSSNGSHEQQQHQQQPPAPDLPSAVPLVCSSSKHPSRFNTPLLHDECPDLQPYPKWLPLRCRRGPKGKPKPETIRNSSAPQKNYCWWRQLKCGYHWCGCPTRLLVGVAGLEGLVTYRVGCEEDSKRTGPHRDIIPTHVIRLPTVRRAHERDSFEFRVYEDHVVAEVDITYSTDATASVSSSSECEVKILKEERPEQQHKQLVWVSNLLYLQGSMKYNKVDMQASDVITQYVKSCVRPSMVSWMPLFHNLYHTLSANEWLKLETAVPAGEVTNRTTGHAEQWGSSAKDEDRTDRTPRSVQQVIFGERLPRHRSVLGQTIDRAVQLEGGVLHRRTAAAIRKRSDRIQRAFEKLQKEHGVGDPTSSDDALQQADADDDVTSPLLSAASKPCAADKLVTVDVARSARNHSAAASAGDEPEILSDSDDASQPQDVIGYKKLKSTDHHALTAAAAVGNTTKRKTAGNSSRGGKAAKTGGHQKSAAEVQTAAAAQHKRHLASNAAAATAAAAAAVASTITGSRGRGRGRGGVSKSRPPKPPVAAVGRASAGAHADTNANALQLQLLAMGAKASRVQLTVGGAATASGTRDKTPTHGAGSDLHTVSSTQSSMHETGVGIGGMMVGGSMPYASSFFGNPPTPAPLSALVLQQQQLMVLQGQMLQQHQYQQQQLQQQQYQQLQVQHQQLPYGFDPNSLHANVMGTQQNAGLQVTEIMQHGTGLAGVHESHNISAAQALPASQVSISNILRAGDDLDLAYSVITLSTPWFYTVF